VNNVLIIFSDQMRADALGCYGNGTVDTPALDGLAATGAVYDSAYTPCPVCVPARSSFITGLEPQHGDCYENEMPMSQASTFMDELSAKGYRTHGVGKMHFPPSYGRGRAHLVRQYFRICAAAKRRAHSGRKSRSGMRQSPAPLSREQYRHTMGAWRICKSRP